MILNKIISSIKEDKKDKYFVVLISTYTGIDNITFPLDKTKYEIIKLLKQSFNEDGTYKKDKNISLVGFTGSDITKLLEDVLDPKVIEMEDGLEPQDIWLQNRINKLGNLISKYIKEGKVIPTNYSEELNKLNVMLNNLIHNKR